jgi:hypothetical protein
VNAWHAQIGRPDSGRGDGTSFHADGTGSLSKSMAIARARPDPPHLRATVVLSERAIGHARCNRADGVRPGPPFRPLHTWPGYRALASCGAGRAGRPNRMARWFPDRSSASRPEDPQAERLVPEILSPPTAGGVMENMVAHPPPYGKVRGVPSSRARLRARHDVWPRDRCARDSHSGVQAPRHVGLRAGLDSASRGPAYVGPPRPKGREAHANGVVGCVDPGRCGLRTEPAAQNAKHQPGGRRCRSDQARTRVTDRGPRGPVSGDVDPALSVSFECLPEGLDVDLVHLE